MRPAPFHGWRIVAALAVVQGCGIGLLNSYGLIVEPLAAEFDASVATIGAGMSIFILSMALCTAALGPLLDRGWIRSVMSLGILTMAAGTAGLAASESLLQLGLALAVTSVGIAAYGPVPTNVVLMNWFERRRGTAVAIAAAGAPTIGFVVPGATAWLLERGGWRLALVTLGCTFAAIALPTLLAVVVRRPSDVGQFVDGEPGEIDRNTTTKEPEDLGGVVRSRDFWLLALGFGLYFAVPVGTGLFMVPLLLEHGFDPWTAAAGATLAAGSNVVGTITAGAIADRWSPRSVLLATLALFFSTLCLLGWTTTPAVAFAALAPLTFCFGAGQPILPLLVGGRFGTEVVGRALGITGAVGLPFMILAGPLAGWLRDTSGTYRSVFLGAAAVMVAAAALLVAARPAPSRDAS